MRVKRLVPGDDELARQMFTLMAEVFEEEHEPLSDGYLHRLLSRKEFWAVAAFVGEEPIGGLTAHTFPMTRIESSEIFIYDIAVHADYQRRGVGRALITLLRKEAARVGTTDLFVPADSEDVQALDFYRALGAVPSPVTFFTFSSSEG